MGELYNCKNGIQLLQRGDVSKKVPTLPIMQLDSSFYYTEEVIELF